LSALIGIKVLALVSVAAAALAFALVIGHEWGASARWSSRALAVLWAATVLSAAFPFALGVALALLGLWALQNGKRAWFAVFVVLTLTASPLAFLFLVLVLTGRAVTRRPRRSELALPAAVIGSAIFGEAVLMRLFPDSGHFPYHPEQLILALSFCVLGA